jgi:putative flippase GtrA
MTVIAAEGRRPCGAPPPRGSAGTKPRIAGQFVRFVAVGAVNTVLFLAVYLMFRTVVSATAASLLANGLTTITGTRANGTVTFGVVGAIRLGRYLRSMVITGLGLLITTGAVSVIHTGSEVLVLLAAGAVAGLLRFVLLRYWVFTPQP